MDDVVTPSSFAYSVDTEDSSVDDNEFNRALPNSEVQGFTVFGSELPLVKKTAGEDLERFLQLQ